MIDRNEIGFLLDESCPLMRDLDMLQPFESIKKMKRRGEWQCTRCNKLFRGEDYVSKTKELFLGTWHLADALPSHCSGLIVRVMEAILPALVHCCGLLVCKTSQLDKHLSRKHMDLLNHSASTCLEDYCDILECDHDRSLKVSKTLMSILQAHVAGVYEWSLNVALP